LVKRLQADPDLARISVVFLTASATRDQAEALRALGTAGVLFKPFNVRELPRKLFEIWNGLKHYDSGANPVAWLSCMGRI
jgi:CheY-like chemotaxis protein